MKGRWPSEVGNLGVDTFNLFHLLSLLRCVGFGKKNYKMKDSQIPLYLSFFK